MYTRESFKEKKRQELELILDAMIQEIDITHNTVDRNWDKYSHSQACDMSIMGVIAGKGYAVTFIHPRENEDKTEKTSRTYLEF